MIEALLADPRWSKEAVPHAELRGFLFAVLNGPERIPPSEWRQEIFGGVEPEYESTDQLQSVMDELMALNNAIVTPLATNPAGLPPGVVFREPPLANFEDGAPLAAWARGFMRGYGWIEESWEGVPEEFGSVIAALGFFSSKRFAADVFKASTGKLAELAANTLEVFPEAAVDYQRIGRSVADETDETD
jgi:yecA family protein